MISRKGHLAVLALLFFILGVGAANHFNFHVDDESSTILMSEREMGYGETTMPSALGSLLMYTLGASTFTEKHVSSVQKYDLAWHIAGLNSPKPTEYYYCVFVIKGMLCEYKINTITTIYPTMTRDVFVNGTDISFLSPNYILDDIDVKLLNLGSVL